MTCDALPCVISPVHLEDPTLLEIAELLDAEGPNQKYTVMLVSRDGDAVDVADFVQMCNEDSYESVSCSPVQVSESHQQIGVSASKVGCVLCSAQL